MIVGNEPTRSASGDFASLAEIIEHAHDLLPKETWDSLVGGSETETTLKRNRLAIDSIAFKPRVLRICIQQHRSQHQVLSARSR